MPKDNTDLLVSDGMEGMELIDAPVEIELPEDIQFDGNITKKQVIDVDCRIMGGFLKKYQQVFPKIQTMGDLIQTQRGVFALMDRMRKVKGIDGEEDGDVYNMDDFSG